jgi:hypothetical protein
MKYLRQIAISAVSVFVIVAFIFLVMVILPLMGVDTKAGYIYKLPAFMISNELKEPSQTTKLSSEEKVTTNKRKMCPAYHTLTWYETKHSIQDIENYYSGKLKKWSKLDEEGFVIWKNKTVFSSKSVFLLKDETNSHRYGIQIQINSCSEEY